MKERIKVVDGYSRYLISESGDVYSECGATRVKLNTYFNEKGYETVYLYGDRGNSSRKFFFVHRLVALHYIENPDNLPQVNHKNGIKNDNSKDNLEWRTNSQNLQHARDNGLVAYKRGESNGCSKYTEDLIRSICDLIVEGMPRREIVAFLGVRESLVKDIRSGRAWTHVTNDYKFPARPFKR